MWWPRPRWKNNLFTHFTLLLIITITLTTNTVMADNEGQNCDASNMSAVVWTTALCTMLLVLIVVAIYFVFCKKRERDWSSMWRKNNPDKNLVLQTSGPMKDHQLKNGGTDNPAFLADPNTGDRATVGRAGLTRIVHVSSSAIDSGSLGIELSSKEDGGRIIYMCKHNDGSKDQLASLRLVFNNGQKQQCSSSSNLSRALVELCREYGLLVELETKSESVTSSSEAHENSDDEVTSKCVKSNLLSTVRGKAQSLWNQRQFVFKGGQNNDDRKNANIEIGVSSDVENGLVKEHSVSVSPVQNFSCLVTTIDETTPVVAAQNVRTGNESVQYHTLEYGASPADMAAYSSPDSSVQCCTINSSEPPAAVTTVESASMTVNTLDTIDGERKPRNDEQKTGASNPPPPPPRKYSTPAVIIPSAPESAVTTRVSATTVEDGTPVAVSTSTATVCTSVTASATTTDVDLTVIAAAVTASSLLPSTSKVAPLAFTYSAPDKRSASTENEIRMNDDYYWCTTTTMASPMSTFGKRLADDGDNTSVNKNDARNAAVKNGNESTVPSSDSNDTGSVVAVDVDDVNDSGVGSQDIVIGGTTSIEDASLPSFSSDEDDDDENGVFAEKTKPALLDVTTVETNPSSRECHSTLRDSTLVCENNNDREKNARDQVVTKIDCNSQSRVAVAPVVTTAVPEPKLATKLPTLRLSLSSPLQSSTATTSCCSSSSSSTASTSSSPTNNGSTNHSPIVSKIPVRRQSASSGGGTPTAVSTPIINNGTPKKAIPLPLSRSGSRLAMWSSAN